MVLPNTNRAWDKKHGTWNVEHGTWNVEHGTWNVEHETWNVEHGTIEELTVTGKIDKYARTST
jgi:hypothetical protein